MDNIITTSTVFAFPARDERTAQPTAREAHEWCAARNLQIHAPLWGSGAVMTADRREVHPDCLPAVVKRHIGFAC